MSKGLDDIKTEAGFFPRDKRRRNLFTAYAVSGMEVARARLGRLCRTWETSDAIAAINIKRSLRVIVQGRNASRRNGECESTDAQPSGGPSRSSDEGSVMEPERRGRVIQVQTTVTRRAE